MVSLKSSLTSNLNHSNRIRNDQVMAKILTLVRNRKLGTGTDTGTSGHNAYGIGTTLFGTGTTLQKLSRKVVFLPFFHIFLPKLTQ